MSEIYQKFSTPNGISFRLYLTTTSSSGFWAFLTDKETSVFIPVLMLSIHKIILEGLRSNILTKEDCGIYTSMIHNWKTFGVIPEFLHTHLEVSKIDGKLTTVVRPYIRLRQENELGVMIGNVSLTIPDSIVFSELLNTPIIISEASVEALGIRLNHQKGTIESQILKVVSDFESTQPNKQE